MAQQNVNIKSATTKPSAASAPKSAFEYVLDRAAYNVASDEEACLHYGDSFTRTERVQSWLSGALAAIQSLRKSRVSRSLPLRNTEPHQDRDPSNSTGDGFSKTTS